MAEGRQDAPLPEISEQIHLPGPSYTPVVVALGITIALVGVVLSWVVTGIGALIFLAGLIPWIRDTRRDIAELPLSHGENH